MMYALLKKALPLFLCIILFLTLLPESADGKAPKLSAQSAVLLDQSSGRVLYAKESQKQLPIASITKVMTAILAIESGKMNQWTRVTPEAVRTEGSSLYLKAGEKIKLRDLVYGLMLRSGNDASLAIAQAVAGSVPGFVFLMNEKAKEIGMVHSHFANPNGLENPDHYSTAYDMALLTRYAMQNRQFREIVGTRVYRAAATNKSPARAWLNKNKMLRQYKYATGGKTGFTKDAGRTLISTAAKGNMNLIAVTLNDRDDWRDHKNLMEWGFQNYRPFQVVQKGIIREPVADFYQNRLFSKNSAYLLLTQKESKKIVKKLILIRPAKNNEQWMPSEPAGYMLIVLCNHILLRQPVYYQPHLGGKISFFSLIETAFNSIISSGEEQLP